jgi:four helix bundle protein
MAVAKRFEDLICWQVAVELRELVCRMTDQGPVLKDFKFRDQIRDSACSAPSNMAEGFARFDPPEFARFLNIARSSLSETQDRLIHGRDQKYFTPDDFTAAWRLSCRALRASNRLHQYLRRLGRKKPFIPPRPKPDPEAEDQEPEP